MLSACCCYTAYLIRYAKDFYLLCSVLFNMTIRVVSHDEIHPYCSGLPSKLPSKASLKHTSEFLIMWLHKELILQGMDKIDWYQIMFTIPTAGWPFQLAGMSFDACWNCLVHVNASNPIIWNLMHRNAFCIYREDMVMNTWFFPQWVVLKAALECFKMFGFFWGHYCFSTILFYWNLEVNTQVIKIS